MKEMKLTIPDSLDMDATQLTIFLASQLYEQGKLTLGQAAEMASLSKSAFAELLNSYGVSIFNSPVEELTLDVMNA